MKKSLVSMFLLFVSLQFAAVLNVGTDLEYTTIQTAIDASSLNDTILIAPGVYQENIIPDKGLTIGSYFLTTQDTTYVSQTIIDGNDNGSCIQIWNLTESLNIVGLKLINGNGTYYLSQSNFAGGGIFLESCDNISLINNIITDCTAMNTGGGIYSSSSSVFFSGNLVYNNSAGVKAGGVLFGTHRPVIVSFDANNKNSIYNNYSSIIADLFLSGDLGLTNVSIGKFTVEDYDWHQYHSFEGHNLYYEEVVNEAIYEDVYISASGDDNNSGLTAEEPKLNIMKAISLMRGSAENPLTLHIAEGYYSESENEQIFPIFFRKGVSIIGESMDGVILDGERKRIFQNEGNASNIIFETEPYLIGSIKNLTLHDFKGFSFQSFIYPPSKSIIDVENIKFTMTPGSWTSTDINWCFNSYSSEKASFKNIFIEDFQALAIAGIRYGNQTAENLVIENRIPEGYEGGRALTIAEPGSQELAQTNPTYVSNLLIYNNRSYTSPDWLYDCNVKIDFNFSSAPAYISNATIVDNNSSFYLDNATFYLDSSKCGIYNSIFYNNTVDDTDNVNFLYLNRHNVADSFVDLDYNLIEDGFSSCLAFGDDNFTYGENNIDADPLFVGGDEHPYQLSSNSPCIDAGSIDVLPEGFPIPETDIMGNPRIMNNGIDIGAYEYQGVSIDEVPLVLNNKLKVYPNPFYANNSRSSINFSAYLPEEGFVEIDIFNIKGQKVANVIDDFHFDGEFNCTWNLRNDNNKKVASGHYFAKMKLNDKAFSIKKFVVLK